MTRYELSSQQGRFAVDVETEGAGFRVVVNGEVYLLNLKKGEEPNSVVVEVGGKPVSVALIEAGGRRVELLMDGERLVYQRPTATPDTHVQTVPEPPAGDLATAPMPGKVIAALVRQGEKVRAGDPLVILESMKMEMAVRSARDAEVDEILVSEGQSVKRGQGLVRLR